MTAITVLNQDNVPTGPFTRAQVAEKLEAGEFSLESLAFVEGLTQWTPLRDVLAKVDAAAMPVPVIPPPSFTPPPAMSPPVAPAYSYAATMQPPGHLVYGGFWLRFAAYFIDALILCIPVIILLVILGMAVGGFAAMTAGFSQSSGNENSDRAVNVALPAGVILFELVIGVGFGVVSWLYYALLESGPGQSTYGKRVMGLKVTNMAGERISFGHASGRFFSKIITGLVPFAIGYIMAGLTERKQALHDLIAGTLVIRG